MDGFLKPRKTLEQMLEEAGIPTSIESGYIPMETPAPAIDPMTDLLDKYFSGGADYAAKSESAMTRRAERMAAAKAARERATAKLGAGPSKAELYFNLAQAFLEPGKTGDVTEGLSRAFGVTSKYQEGKRLAEAEAAQAAELAAAEEAQAEAEGAQQEALLYKGLAERSDEARRSVMADIIKKRSESAGAQSTFGKQAMDEGFKPGTPEFQNRVKELQLRSVEASEARFGLQAAAGERAAAASERAAAEAIRKGQEMSPKEIDLLVSTEDARDSAETSEAMLNEALRLNEIAFTSDPAGLAARATAEAADPDSPKVVATRDLENILRSRALEALKATFSGAISDAETRILTELQGIDAKSKEERKRIMTRALELVAARRRRAATRIERIRKGEYRYRGDE
jgi:hypothetical protein